MRAYELRGEELDTLVRADRNPPKLGPGQVRVRIRATSLNYRDLLIATGRYPIGKIRFPLVPLSDGAGQVVELGEGVKTLRKGDRVIGNFFQKWADGPFDAGKAQSALGGAIDGVLAEQVVWEEDCTVKIPLKLSFEEAATLPCAGLTAWVGLVELGGLTSGQTVLAMGTGGVSIFALQIAKNRDAKVLLTSSQDAKLDAGRAMGADATVNYRNAPNWDESARAFTNGAGVDHLLEVGGESTLPVSLRALREGGHLALVGLLGGKPADPEKAASNERGIRVDRVYVGSAAHLRSFCEFIRETNLHPVIDRVFPFEQTREAYAHLESGKHIGNVVIRL